MSDESVETTAARKQRAMWVILGAIAAVIGLILWLTGRKKDARFSADALRRRFFGGSEEG